MYLKNVYNYYLKPLLKFNSFFQSIYFNFKYLPFRQAIYLPIYVYKPHFIKWGGGKVKIECKKIKPGMISIGFWGGHMYPNNGFYWMHEGEIVFKGRAQIANDSYVITGKNGKIVFGENFVSTSSLKILSYTGITFDNNCSIGWGCVIMDNSVHPIYDNTTHESKKPYAPIHIGAYNWLAAQSCVLPGVKTPERCIFGARSVLTQGVQYESFCVHAGSPLRVVSRNKYRRIGEPGDIVLV